MWALKLLLVLLAIYAGVVLIAYTVQTWLLFPTNAVGGVLTMRGAERLTCRTPDGELLQGVRIGPAAAAGEPRTMLLGFGGNAWNAEHMAAYLHELFPAAAIVTFHYRGYPPSSGRPSAAALLRDAPLVYDCATEGREPSEVVAVGFSVGSGPAARVARERPLDGLILVTPFDTLEKLAREHYGWLPVRLLLRHRMSPLDELRGVTTPVALIAAEKDTIIPGERTAPLREAARALVLDRTIPGAGHNDIYANAEFAEAMREAVTLIEERARGDRTTRPATGN